MKSREKCMLGLLIRYAPIGVRKKKMPEEMFLPAGFIFSAVVTRPSSTIGVKLALHPENKKIFYVCFLTSCRFLQLHCRWRDRARRSKPEEKSCQPCVIMPGRRLRRQ